MQVLVVDDHPDVAAVLQVYCQLAGYTTEIATDLPAAREALARSPQVVFLDWFIGDQRADVLANDVAASSAKVILMSGSGTGELRHGSMVNHVDHLLGKPFNRQQIAEILQKLIGS